jgi:small subunit ribosomal protein S9
MERKKKSRKAARKVKEKAKMKKEKEIIFTVGKRKRAVARCAVKQGSGVVLINSDPLENIKNEVLRLRLSEPFIMSGDGWKSYDFIVNVKGGGVSGQAEAARQAIARGLLEIFGSELKGKFMEYDRNLLVYDPRRTEPHKPPRSSQGPRRYKQRSKR